MLELPTGSQPPEEDSTVDATKTLSWLNRQQQQRPLSVLEKLAQASIFAELKTPEKFFKRDTIQVNDEPDILPLVKKNSPIDFALTNEATGADSRKLFSTKFVIDACKIASQYISQSISFGINKIRQLGSCIPTAILNIKTFLNSEKLLALRIATYISIAVYTFSKGQSILPGFFLVAAWHSLFKSTIPNTIAAMTGSGRSGFINFSDISKQEIKNFDCGSITSKDPDAHKLLYVTNISLPLSNTGKVAPAFDFNPKKLNQHSEIGPYMMQRHILQQEIAAAEQVPIHPENEPTGKEIDISFTIKKNITCLPVPVEYRVTHAVQYENDEFIILFPSVSHCSLGSARLETPVRGKILYRLAPITDNAIERVPTFFHNFIVKWGDSADLQIKLLNGLEGEPKAMVAALNLRSPFWDDNPTVGSQMKLVAGQSQLYNYWLVTRTGVCDALAWGASNFLNIQNINAYHTVGLVSSAYDGKGDGKTFGATPHAAVSYYDTQEKKFCPLDPSAVAGHGSDFAPLNKNFRKGLFGRLKLLKQLRAGISHSDLFGMPKRLEEARPEETFPELHAKVIEVIKKNALSLVGENPQLFGSILDCCVALLPTAVATRFRKELLNEYLSIVETDPNPENTQSLAQWVHARLPVFKYSSETGPSRTSPTTKKGEGLEMNALVAVLRHAKLTGIEISDLITVLLYTNIPTTHATGRATVGHFAATCDALATALQHATELVPDQSAKILSILISKHPIWRDTDAESALLSVLNVLEHRIGAEALLTRLAPFGKALPACLQNYFTAVSDDVTLKAFFASRRYLPLTTLVGIQFLTNKDLRKNKLIQKIQNRALKNHSGGKMTERDILEIFVSDRFIGPSRLLALEMQEKLLTNATMSKKSSPLPRRSDESLQPIVERAIVKLENHGSDEERHLAALLKEQLSHAATLPSTRRTNGVTPRRVFRKEDLLPIFIDIVDQYAAAGRGDLVVRQLAYGQIGRQSSLIEALTAQLKGVTTAEYFTAFFKTSKVTSGAPVNRLIRNMLSLTAPSMQSKFSRFDTRLSIHPRSRLFEYESTSNNSLKFDARRTMHVAAGGYDTKQYTPGDSLRYADWKYFARNNTLVLRTEQNISVDNRVCILDARDFSFPDANQYVLSSIYAYAIRRKIRIGISIQWDTTEIATISDIRLFHHRESFLQAFDGLTSSATAAAECERKLNTFITGPSSLLPESPLRRKNAQVIVISNSHITAKRLVNAATTRGNFVQDRLSTDQLFNILHPAVRVLPVGDTVKL